MEWTIAAIITVIIQIIGFIWFLSKQNSKLDSTKKELDEHKKEMKDIVRDSFNKHEQHDVDIKELKNEMIIQQTKQLNTNREILSKLTEMNDNFKEIKEIIQVLKDDNLANKLYHKICPYYNGNRKDKE